MTDPTIFVCLAVLALAAVALAIGALARDPQVPARPGPSEATPDSGEVDRQRDTASPSGPFE